MQWLNVIHTEMGKASIQLCMQLYCKSIVMMNNVFCINSAPTRQVQSGADNMQSDVPVYSKLFEQHQEIVYEPIPT